MTNALIKSIEIENPLLFPPKKASEYLKKDPLKGKYNSSMRSLKNHLRALEIREYINYVKVQRGEKSR